MLAYVSSWPSAQEWSSALFTTSHLQNPTRNIACTFPSQFLSPTVPLPLSHSLQTSLWNLKICHNFISSTFTFLLLCISQSQIHLPLSLFLPCSFFYLDQISQNRQVFLLLCKFYIVCKAYRHGQPDSLPYSVFHELVKIVLKGQGWLWGLTATINFQE